MQDARVDMYMGAIGLWTSHIQNDSQEYWSMDWEES